MPRVSRFDIAAGLSESGKSLGFLAQSVLIDNPTNQWLNESSSRRWIGPYTTGVIVPCWGVQSTTIENSAPQSMTQAPAIAGEYATAAYSDEVFGATAGITMAQARAAYYYANPKTIALGVAQVFSPHGTVQRLTYTVPPGRAAFLEMVTMLIVRQVVATAFVPALISVVYTPRGLATVQVAAIFEQQNLQYASPPPVTVPGVGLLLPGDNVVGEDADGSTGGQVQFNYAIKGTEFDL